MASAALSLDNDATHRVLLLLPPFKEKLRTVSFNIAMKQGNLASGSDIKSTLDGLCGGANVDVLFLCVFGDCNERPFASGVCVNCFLDTNEYKSSVLKNHIVLWRNTIDGSEHKLALESMVEDNVDHEDLHVCVTISVFAVKEQGHVLLLVTYMFRCRPKGKYRLHRNQRS